MAGDSLRCFGGYGRRVTVCDEVAGIWHGHRQTAAGAAETFGVLMGTTSVDRREIWIEAVTTPMADDRCSRFSFALRDPGHQRAVCEKFNYSGGRAIYLGTWHTHPEPIPTPSGGRPERLGCVPAGEPWAPASIRAGGDRGGPRVRADERALQAAAAELRRAMASVDPKESTIVQTREPPMTALDAVKDHAAAVRALVSWDRVGVLMDDGPQAIVTVLLDGDTVASASRFCLSAAQSVDALRAYNEGTTDPMELRCWQGHTMTGEQTRSLAELETIWKESSGQRKEQGEEDWRTFFKGVEADTRKKGRGTGISTGQRNQVLLDAHGRCMFEGCGADPDRGSGDACTGQLHDASAQRCGVRGRNAGGAVPVGWLGGTIQPISCCSAKHTTG